MEDIINFQIRNFGPIKECDMDIGKINVIGGPNASGKSNASKLLYCFLKASSNQRQEFAYDSIYTRIRSIVGRYNEDIRFGRKEREMDIFELLEEYENAKDNYVYSSETVNKFLDRDIRIIDNSLEEIQHNGDSFYLSLLKNLLVLEFSRKHLNGSVSFNDGSDNDCPISIEEFFKLDAGLKDSIDEKYKPKNYLDVYDVFYIDSFSIFDLNRFPHLGRTRRNFYDHIDYLRFILRDGNDESTELFDDKRNIDIINVEEKIEEIIGGRIELKDGRFNFNTKNGPFRMQDTASGIKQIGVIQLLLSSRKLKEDSFLIIDEPEVNLHPEWQFKLAEILVLLVKDLNISIYLNTHSPMFIEAIEVFSKYYGLEDDTYYYLSKYDIDSDKPGYIFEFKDGDELYELYDNLAGPYDKIDHYRLKSELRKDD